MKGFERRIGVWQTTVGGTGSPAAASLAVARYLSTQVSRRGRRIEHRDAGRLSAVQQVHAKDDLFQRPRRHGADDDGVIARQRIGIDANAGRQPTKIEHLGRMAEVGRRPLQIADVPAVAAGENCEQHWPVPEWDDGRLDGRFTRIRQFANDASIPMLHGLAGPRLPDRHHLECKRRFRNAAERFCAVE